MEAIFSSELHFRVRAVLLSPVELYSKTNFYWPLFSSNQQHLNIFQTRFKGQEFFYLLNLFDLFLKM